MFMTLLEPTSRTSRRSGQSRLALLAALWVMPLLAMPPTALAAPDGGHSGTGWTPDQDVLGGVLTPRIAKPPA